jgi:hypothetical protein
MARAIAWLTNHREEHCHANVEVQFVSEHFQVQEGRLTGIPVSCPRADSERMGKGLTQPPTVEKCGLHHMANLNIPALLQQNVREGSCDGTLSNDLLSHPQDLPFGWRTPLGSESPLFLWKD